MNSFLEKLCPTQFELIAFPSLAPVLGDFASKISLHSNSVKFVFNFPNFAGL